MLKRLCLFSGLLALFAAPAQSAIMTGDVLYIYDANLGEDGPALDGSWDHSNGSDAWDESAPGTGGTPGGAVVERENLSFLERPEVLSIVDTGDPRGAGFSDPSNRKIFFTREIAELDPSRGMFVVARWRMDPDPLDTNLDGTISDSYPFANDKGQISLGNGSNSMSFTYQSATEIGIKLNDSDDFATIDIGSSFDFHTLVASMIDNGNGTFAIDVWVDDVLSYQNASVMLDDDSELSSPGIAMGLWSTGRAGAIQVDFIGAGNLVPEPNSLALIGMGLIGLVAIRRKRRK